MEVYHYSPCEQSLLLSFSLLKKSSKQKKGSASRVTITSTCHAAIFAECFIETPFISETLSGERNLGNPSLTELLTLLCFHVDLFPDLCISSEAPF